MHYIHGIQGVQTLALFFLSFFLFLFSFLNFAFECRLLPLRLCPEQFPLTERTCCVVAQGEGGGSGGEGGGGGAGCNRLVTSIGELTLGPFPCQLSPGGDVLVLRILDGSG